MTTRLIPDLVSSWLNAQAIAQEHLVGAANEVRELILGGNSKHLWNLRAAVNTDAFPCMPVYRTAHTALAATLAFCVSTSEGSVVEYL